MSNLKMPMIKKIYQNKSSALIALNTLKIKSGDFIGLRYENSSKGVDALVAFGIRDGIGPDCYSLISDRSIPVITSILDTPPDVSMSVFGEVYLYNDPRSNNYLRYCILENDMIGEEITEDFYFTNLQDGEYYFFDSTPGSQRIINVSANLSEKANFGGIINVSASKYSELLETGQIIDDMVYLVNDGVRVISLYYNYMSFQIGADEDERLRERIEALEKRLSESVVWID